MEKYLVDTHVLIWYLFEPEKLSNKVFDFLKDRQIEVYVSALNFLEISIKSSINKLNLQGHKPTDLLKVCIDNGFLNLEIRSEETAGLYDLQANYRRDPFDRMLIWQAMQNNLVLITDDPQIIKYSSEGLKTIW